MDNEDIESDTEDSYRCIEPRHAVALQASIPRNNAENTDKSDVTTKIVGCFGRWQFKICFLMSLLKFSNAWYQLRVMFMAPDQEFWCAKPEWFKDCTTEQWRKICKPTIEELPCLIFDPDILSVAPDLDPSLIPLVLCKKFEYDRKTFKNTVTAEWNLVCGEHWKIHVTRCMLMWGILVGGVIFGILADKYGRRNPLMLAIVLQCTAGFIVSMAPTFLIFLINWFLVALACGGITIVSFVMCVELACGKWRTIVPILFQLPFGLGTTGMAGLAYWFRDWRKLEFALASLSSLYLFYWFFVPESPLWLIANGQSHKAAEILQKAAVENKREWTLESIKRLLPAGTQTKIRPPGFMAFLKSRKMRIRTIALSANWFCLGLSFYAFSQLLGDMGSNMFSSIAVIGVISSAGPLLCVLIVPKIDRRYTLWIFQLLIAVSFVLILLMSDNVRGMNDWPRILFAGIGFAGMAAIVPTFYLYSGELFPTIGRNAGVAGVTMFARLGSMVAPFVVMLESYRPNTPLMLLTGMSFVQILFLLPLPETKNKALPVTIDDIEKEIGK